MRTDHAISCLRRGSVLVLTHLGDEGDGFSIVPGGGVSPAQARALIRDMPLQPSRDGLLDNCEPQTWRLADAPAS